MRRLTDSPVRQALRESAEDRSEKCPGRYLIEPHGHERHWLHGTQPLREAPAEQICVTHRQRESRPSRRRCRANQRLELFFRLSHRVREETDVCGIPGHSPVMLHNPRGALGNRIGDLLTTIMSVHAQTEPIAGVQIVSRRRCTA